MTEAAATITSHMPQQPPLLIGAPVTKTFVIFSALLYVLSESMEWQDQITLGTLHISNKFHLYPTNHITSSTFLIRVASDYLFVS